MKSLVFFNNKGGVGKTTLACNLVGYLNTHKNIRVLLIDADPQCNATQAMLSDETCEQIYFDESSEIQTLYDYLSPLEQGEPTIKVDIKPVLGSQNRYQTDIIPGHPRMSIVEDRLSDAWSKLQGRDIAGFRVTNWCTQLLKSLEGKYDLVVFDVGPSLGALNRTVILSCDYIVTPFGCDIFSLLGIKNISTWITTWNRQYKRAISDAMDDTPHIFSAYPVINDTSDKFRFAGYSVQQYVTRTFKTGPRPVKSYDKIMTRIPSTVTEAMGFIQPATLEQKDMELGHIPYVYSLVPMAQSAKAPIYALNNSDGLVGSQYSQVNSFAAIMSKIADRLLHNLEIS